MGCQCTKSNEANNMNLETGNPAPKNEPLLSNEVNFYVISLAQNRRDD
jgi:hypothetical protein